jgi:hypothetical protein
MGRRRSIVRFVVEVLVKKAWSFEADTFEDADRIGRAMAKEDKTTIRCVKPYEMWERDETVRTETHNPDARPPKRAA